ncbi:MAG: SpoIIE family protein phosphatase [Bacteroidales bacterium]|jgi:hypothetical protein|nr:SpoIIE family protein phosphatase [Bacteroidales bacterium]
MKSTDKWFIEVDSYQHSKHNMHVCGDVFLSRKVKDQNRVVAILSDGLGSGIKANVLATMTASMALNFTLENQPILRTAETILNTLPVCGERKIAYATFTIIDIDYDGETRIVEYGNPSCLIFRGNKIFKPEWQNISINTKDTQDKTMYLTSFVSCKEDRIITYSDGISQSGIGTKLMPFGWGNNEIEHFAKNQIAKNINISARSMAKNMVMQAWKNDISEPKDDTSCGVIYFRSPRRMLLLSGPPFNSENDQKLADIIDKFPGKKVICGGTTSQIVARVLNREVTVGLGFNSLGLPPESSIDGIDLVTEGILTIGKVSEILENGNGEDIKPSSPAHKLVMMLLKSDEIDFLIGTRVNNAHQDPSLPVELEIRRSVIKKIIKLLEEKYLKKINLEFI